MSSNPKQARASVVLVLALVLVLVLVAVEAAAVVSVSMARVQASCEPTGGLEVWKLKGQSGRRPPSKRKPRTNQPTQDAILIDL
ncbi:hypothetical protein BZA05DRAFT_446795 [Tricharina praecox]|uniref:uncharacterized protein n=1 Tax=Tricharina praecox TaxID=43433 RepID=UPI00221FDC00|nr:uncharacterized protein BZA05DRAFT_446795 [Tricharina praecox]KAI5848081.1 hypothetical protein BZA05DRAFT_446795 [Tricharina praecox]